MFKVVKFTSSHKIAWGLIDDMIVFIGFRKHSGGIFLFAITQFRFQIIELLKNVLK